VRTIARCETKVNKSLTVEGRMSTLFGRGDGRARSPIRRRGDSNAAAEVRLSIRIFRSGSWSEMPSSEMERVKGIEPLYAAWEAAVLPVNYTRAGHRAAQRGAMMLRVIENLS
jgi:hypothetical protein